MGESYHGVLVAFLVFVASVIAVESGLSAAIVEIAIGVLAGSFLGLQAPEWLTYFAGFGGILLTFLAGAEVDVKLLRAKLKESLLIGGVSFFAPFFGALAYCHWVAGWSLQASQIAGIALSTTSLAVIYAVLVETGLTDTEIGKIIIASCFITDLGTALALSVLFAQINWYMLVFVLTSLPIILFSPKLLPPLFARYGNRVIEPEIKLVFLILFLFIFTAKLAATHAMLPTFVWGLAMSGTFNQDRHLQRRLRVVSFAMITPFFFINGGLNVSLKMLWQNAGLFLILLGVKQVMKIGGIYPLARRYVPREAMFTTLLMSTGLTMGTLSSMFGLEAGIITQAQFTVLVAVVVASAIVPTVIAQRWFEPRHILTELKEDDVPFAASAELE